MPHFDLILLVEDDPDDEQLTKMVFEDEKVCNEIRVARDGEEALDFLFGENPIPLPQLILLDLRLPKIDGLQVLSRIRQEVKTKDIPVIVLTSSQEERDMVASFEIGTQAFIQKPVFFETFNRAVKDLGLFWLLLNQHPDKISIS